MTVTIDGITYEGTVAEIRDIVSNPPTRPQKEISLKDLPAVDFPKDDDNNTNHSPRDRRFREWEKEVTPFAPTTPFPTTPFAPTPPYPGTRSWPEDFPRQWDGSPIVTCGNPPDPNGGMCGTSKNTSSPRGCSTMY